MFTPRGSFFYAFICQKTTMKRFYLIFALGLMVAAGCERLDTPFGRGTAGGRSGRDSGLEQKDSTAGNAPDTVCFAAVVKVPDGYDWMRDTLAGLFSGELLFYRGGNPCLSIPLDGSVPVSPDPGTHHIIRGHLYTECCSGGSLHILRDGVPLLHLPGDGFLKGLLQVADGSLWTLVCTPADGGLTLRRNGETVIRIARGSAVGGLGEGHSALYEDDGHVCFSYTEGDSFFAVKDGGISPIKPPEEGAYVDDFLWRDGEALTLYKKNDVCYLHRNGISTAAINSRSHCTFVETGGGLYVFGRSNYISRNLYFSWNAESSEVLYFYGTEPWLHSSEAGLFTVQGSSPLRVSGWAKAPLQQIPHTDREGMMVFSDECVASIGRDAYLGASVPGGRPLLIRGSRAVGEFPFDGYITTVDVEITAPNL